MISKEQFIEEYRIAAELYGNAMQDGKYKIVNSQYRVIKKLYLELEKHPNSRSEILGKLLVDKSDNVKIWAAAHCLGLGVFQREAEGTLKNISKKREIEILRFNAEMTLKVWKKQGYLRF